jgi:regulatory protein
MDYVITAISAQKNNKDRVSISLDGQFEFGLTKILAVGLHIGDKLDEKRINNLKQSEIYESTYLRALNFIAYKPRTENEVRKKLCEKTIDSNVIDQVIDRLNQNGYLNDQQFAQNWVDNRLEFKPRGKRLLKIELKRKGLDEELIDSSLTSISNENKIAYQAANKYAPRLANLDWQHFKSRLSGFLLRRGFNYSDVKEVVVKVWKEIKLNKEN